jgi:hypothetical protein
VLLEEVWGDADDDHAKLKVTVGRLRKRLGFATIRSLGAGYAIGENVTCTLAELEELASRAEPFGPATIARLEGIRQRHRRGMTGVARHWPWYTAWSAKIDAFVEHAALALRALVAQGNIVAARQLLAAYGATLESSLGIAPPEALLRIVRERAS